MPVSQTHTLTALAPGRTCRYCSYYHAVGAADFCSQCSGPLPELSNRLHTIDQLARLVRHGDYDTAPIIYDCNHTLVCEYGGVKAFDAALRELWVRTRRSPLAILIGGATHLDIQLAIFKHVDSLPIYRQPVGDRAPAAPDHFALTGYLNKYAPFVDWSVTGSTSRMIEFLIADVPGQCALLLMPTDLVNTTDVFGLFPPTQQYRIVNIGSVRIDSNNYANVT